MSFPTVGPEIRNFLLQYFKEDASERETFDKGIVALRRTEIVKLCRLAGLEISETMAHTNMVPIVESWIREGRFDHMLPKGPVMTAEIREVVERAVAAKLAEQTSKKAASEDDGETIQSLRKRARALGFNAWGMGKAAIRQRIAEHEAAAATPASEPQEGITTVIPGPV